MKEYIYENLNKCCEEFQKMLLLDKYISKKMLESYLDKYQDTFKLVYKNYISPDDILYKKVMSILKNSYSVIEDRNKKYVENKLIELKEYFDNMFKNIDDGIVLDNEQRRAILTDEDYSLIVAGAGSGKTTTIAAKVKYLIEKCNVKPESIILLSYSNKASEELNEKLNTSFNLNVSIKTFNELGYEFINKISKDEVQIVSNYTLYNCISNYVKNEIFSNKEKLKYFISTFKEYVFFDKEVLFYQNFNEYFNYYVNSRYLEYQGNLKKYNFPCIDSRKQEYKTINGEILRSQSEVMIANFLYAYGLNYEYEKLFPHNVEIDKNYSPDFTITYNGKNIYVEFYGLTTLKKDGTYSVNDIKLYHNLIEKKKILHKKYGTDLIELYSNTNYIEVLYNELVKRKICGELKSSKDIFLRLLNTSQEKQFLGFIKLCEKFIGAFKEKGYTLNDFDILINQEYKENIKKQLLFIKDIYEYYQNYLKESNMVDFSDMINNGTLSVEKLKHDNKFLKYSYIIIDEYQDISMKKYDFAKKISDVFSSKIIAVGDDWQVIYGFNGTDINLFTKFYETMGYANILRLTKSYRTSQELINVASNFINHNNYKTLVSANHMDKPIEIDYYYDNSESKYIVLFNILKRINNKNKNAKVLLLGRYEEDINEYILTGHFDKGSHDSIIYSDIPSMNIDFMTVYRSKGLEYDQVIILNSINGKYGFPSHIEEDEVLKVIDNNKSELIDNPEERRLFYIALTRSKNMVYIMCPYYMVADRSKYVRELSNSEYVTEKLDI